MRRGRMLLLSCLLLLSGGSMTRCVIDPQALFPAIERTSDASPPPPFDPALEKQACLQMCKQVGFHPDDCEAGGSRVLTCLDLGEKPDSCKPRCLPDLIEACYNPCLQSGQPPEGCKRKLDDFRSCSQNGGLLALCKPPCTSRPPPPPP